jgi:hypothetical protein
MAQSVVTPRDVDALHAVPPAEFVAARNALVKQARAARQPDLAAEIAAMRKPNVVVWLVNQLARRHPRDAAALVEAGERLRQTQHRALRGGGADSLREANATWRDTVSRALKTIRDMVGHAIDEPRIVATLLGAATDPELADRLAHGRLEEEAAPPGIEAALGALEPARPSQRGGAKRPAPVTTKPDDERRAERRRRDEAAEKRAQQRSEREAAAQRRRRERALAAARSAAERADGAAARMEKHAAQAAEKAKRARQAANEARRRVAELERAR